MTEPDRPEDVPPEAASPRWPCLIHSGTCRHADCRPVPVAGVTEHLELITGPDGVPPEEWRRGIALIAAASESAAYATATSLSPGTQHVTKRAAQYAEWIRTGELPDA